MYEVIYAKYLHFTLFVTVTSVFLLPKTEVIHDSGKDKHVLGNLLIVKVLFIRKHFWGEIAVCFFLLLSLHYNF